MLSIFPTHSNEILRKVVNFDHGFAILALSEKDRIYCTISI